MSAFGDLIPHTSIKGKLIHKVMKPIIMNAMSYMNGVVDNVIAEKVKNDSWINPEVKILYEIFSEIIAQDKILRLDEKENDSVRAFYCNMRDTSCVILDEDSHYLLRFFLFVELIHENYPKFRIEMHKNRAYWNWEQIYAGIKKDIEMRKQGFEDGSKLIHDDGKLIDAHSS